MFSTPHEKMAVFLFPGILSCLFFFFVPGKESAWSRRQPEAGNVEQDAVEPKVGVQGVGFSFLVLWLGSQGLGLRVQGLPVVSLARLEWPLPH